MKKMGWGFGLAAAGMVFMASHVLAETGTSGTGSTSSGSGTMGESSGSSTTTKSDTSTTMTSDTSSTKSSALQGKVEKFDRSKNTLTLSGSDKTLKVDSSTMVMKNGLSATLDDIKEGDEIRASYSGSGNTVKVKSLDIVAAAPTGSSSGMGTGSSMGTGTDTSNPPASNPPASPPPSSGESPGGTSK